jgi:hypothetical protein
MPEPTLGEFFDAVLAAHPEAEPDDIAQEILERAFPTGSYYAYHINRLL